MLSFHSYCQSTALLIQNIQYVDVEQGSLKKGDIRIQNHRIQEISSTTLQASEEMVIDGTGKWLIPGLVDAHIHLFQSGGIYTRPDVIDLRAIRPYEQERLWLKKEAAHLLKRYLRCGITTVIDVGGPMYNYTLRDSFQTQEDFPNLWLTGPLVSTYQPKAFDIEDSPIIKVNTAEEAVALVQQQLPYQPDFIKIWYITRASQPAESTYAIVEATIQESHKHKLKVAVHATQLNTAKLAIKAGADILVHSIDDPIDEEFIHLLSSKKVIYIPTMVVSGNYVETFCQEPELTAADFAFADPFTLGSLFDSRHLPAGNVFQRSAPFLPQLKKNQQLQDSIRQANLRRLKDEAIIISTGTDAGNIGTLHASSYFEEIAAMQEAGMSHAQILKASTINGARVLGKEQEMGSIAEGKLADLLLLNANPLTDIHAIQDIAYVIKGGKLLAVDSILQDTPESLVQQQLNGYNARDIEAFLAPYAEDVEIYNFPDHPSGKGKANIRPRYEGMFAQLPELHCELVNRIVLGNTVIDQEKVTGFPNGRILEAIAIYKIRNNKIAQVYFIQKE
ncbi:MAG: amidohydrolase family protein [Bacteroidota bacterium]